MAKKRALVKWLTITFLVVFVLVAAGYVGLRYYLSSRYVADQVTSRLGELYGGKVDADLHLKAWGKGLQWTTGAGATQQSRTLEGGPSGPAAESAWVTDPSLTYNRIDVGGITYVGQLPETIVNKVAQETNRGVGLLLDNVKGVVQRVPKKLPSQPIQLPPTFAIDLKMTKVDLAQFIEGMNMKLPFPVSGKLTFQVKAGIPTSALKDFKAYTAKGSATVEDLNLAGVHFTEGHADVDYAKGILILRHLEAKLAPPAGSKVSGSIQGSATLSVVPLGDLKARLTVSDIPVDMLATLVKQQLPIRGRLSGNLQASATGKDLKNLQAWEATGTLQTARLKAYGLTVQKANMALQLKKGVTSLTSISGLVEGTPVTGQVQLTLAKPFPFQGKLQLQKVNLADLQRLPAEVRPALAVEGSFATQVLAKGTLDPLKMDLSGFVQNADVTAFRVKLEQASFQWTTDGDQVTLQKINGNLYGGKVTGNAVVPLRPDRSGALDLNLQDVQVSTLAGDLQLPLAVKGEVDGSVKGMIAKQVPPQQERDVSLTFALKAPVLRVQGIAAEQLDGQAIYKNGKLDYQVSGKTLGGTLQVEGNLPMTTAPAKANPPQPGPVGQGKLTIEGGQLSRLWKDLSRSKARAPLAGTVHLTLEYKIDQTTGPEGSGNLSISQVHWHGKLLSPAIQSTIKLTPERLTIGEFEGPFAGGVLRGRLFFNLEHRGLGAITLQLDQIDTAQLFGPLGVALSGNAGIRLRGTLGREWYGGGEFYLLRGKIQGLDASNVRLPYSWRYYPDEGRGAVTVARGVAQVGQGRVTGRASVTFGGALSVDSRIDFTGVDAQALVRQATSSSVLGRASVNGWLIVKGNNVRSVNDLQGSLQAKLGRNQGLGFPGLQQIAPYLGLTPSFSFNQGRLSATIAKGALQIQQLSLTGNSAQVFAEGRITFQGRLNLFVYAKTGQLGVVDSTRLGQLARKLPLAGPTPVTLIAQTSKILSNRVVYLEVSGTVRSPQVRVQPLRTLSDFALRFFLEQAIPANLQNPGGLNPGGLNSFGGGSYRVY